MGSTAPGDFLHLEGCLAKSWTPPPRPLSLMSQQENNTSSSPAGGLSLMRVSQLRGAFCRTAADPAGAEAA